ncbi:hypothetical protein GCM10011297_35110 [Bacterioplanes sanyensis]|uniref:hypothetical protein n=1 Tax=Bacterioplanes sanyensis TaxID=1249553 RepID=UPI001678647C|nr:hypothetical protein [Bacterioplanes sanyensis]GGY59575.1 hypothetical protein GCM10011297_35110 [Bacterioplanes sanyensis]
MAVANDDGLNDIDILKKYLFLGYSGVPRSERIEEVNRLAVKIDRMMESSPDEPRVNMLKGLQLYAQIYADGQLSKVESQELKLKSQGFLRAALVGNGIDNSLSLSELEIVRAYSGPELIPLVVDQIISYKSDYDEKAIVELKRQKIDNLIRAGRVEAAEQEMVETNLEHPSFKSMEWDSAFEEQIAKVENSNQGGSLNIDGNALSLGDEGTQKGLAAVGEVDSDVIVDSESAEVKPSEMAKKGVEPITKAPKEESNWLIFLCMAFILLLAAMALYLRGRS